jgi:SNF2 family DNA or RNA helicase
VIPLPFLLQRGDLLRPYQREGLDWLVSLHDRRLNGILADEMGLGKTIQTIALFAHLAEAKAVGGPHLILCPKAVLSNWAAEFAAWAPSLPVILYDGNPEQRAALRPRILAAAGRGGQGGSPYCCVLTHYDMVWLARDRI